MQDWDDIRFFLAAGRAGSLSGAARHLGTSQPTVSRRIAALESHYNVSLFDRHQDGVTLTGAGQAIWQQALQMEETAFAIERRILGHDASLSGAVRISATEGLGSLWLTPHLAAFSRQNPGIGIELLSENSVSDLTRREADIAIRLARPLQPDLVGRRVGALAFGLFASRSYAAEFGVPERLEHLSDHRLVDFLWQAWSEEQWHEVVRDHQHITYRSNSSISHLNAVRAGYGIGLLPCYVEGLYPELVALLRHHPWRTREIWLVAHRDLRKTARIRMVFDQLVKLFEMERAALAGQALEFSA